MEGRGEGEGGRVAQQSMNCSKRAAKAGKGIANSLIPTKEGEPGNETMLQMPHAQGS